MGTEPTERNRRFGIDLGRHCLLLATSGPGTRPELVPFGDRDGLVVRWLSNDPDDPPTERLTDRLLRLAGTERHEDAIQLAASVGSVLADRIPDGSDVTCAIPPALGPLGRQALVAGMQQAGVPIAAADLVERPVAALASSLADSQAEPSRSQGQTVLVVDADGGQVTAMVADPEARWLVVCRPVSSGPTDDPSAVVSRLKTLVADAAAVTYRGPMVRPTDWESVSGTIGRVLLTGTGAGHPDLHDIVAAVVPRAVVIDHGARRPKRAVATGLVELDRLDAWRACWPTVDVECGGILAVAAGPNVGLEEHPLPVISGETIGFGRDGQPVDLSLGAVSAAGFRVSAGLGPTPVMKILPDGRLLVLGEAGALPISLHVDWPPPGSRAPVVIHPIGRRAIELDDQSQSRLVTSSQS